MEPASTSITGIIGLKFATLIAGAIGGVISLRYIEELTTFGRVMAVLSGMAIAGYGTPALDSLLDLSSAMENVIAFGLGLTAMNLIPGLLRISALFKEDPLGFIRRVHNQRSHDDEKHH
jgi:hypothetical protein